MPVIFIGFNETWIFSSDFRKIFEYQISLESVQWKPSCSMRADGRTEGRTWRRWQSLFAVFRALIKTDVVALKMSYNKHHGLIYCGLFDDAVGISTTQPEFLEDTSRGIVEVESLRLAGRTDWCLWNVRPVGWYLAERRHMSVRSATAARLFAVKIFSIPCGVTTDWLTI